MPECLFKTSFVMPLNIYKNSEFIIKTTTTTSALEPSVSYDSEFFITNYLKSITLIDLCLFDIEHLKFTYSVLAATALYHTLSSTRQASGLTSKKFAAYIVEKCTGYKLYELDACVKWMCPYLDVCVEFLSRDKLASARKLTDLEDSHNVQIYFNYLDLLVSEASDHIYWKIKLKKFFFKANKKISIYFRKMLNRGKLHQRSIRIHCF